jgi:photosystem II stability/assembly factor-like uncharacterized protein
MPPSISLFLRRTRKKWVLVLAPILSVALICCYGAIAKARRADRRQASSEHSDRPGAQAADRNSHHETDREKAVDYTDKSRELWSKSDKPPGSVSPSAYIAALAAARALPPSPLSQGRTFASLDPLQNWMFPALSPIANDWGGLGAPCTKPLPPNSPCGASSRIDAIAVDPTNADIVYVGSEGGLSKSTDGGAHWSYVSDTFDSQSIRSIVVDPANPLIVYAGTGTNAFYGTGLYRSVDAGATWSLASEIEFYGGTIAKLVIDPSTAGNSFSTTLYASFIRYVSESNNSHSVWKSTDSGSSWTQLRSAPGVAWGGMERFYDLAVDPNIPSTLYVTAPDGVFKRSYMGGRFGGIFVWTKIHDIPNPTVPSCLAFAQSTLYLAYTDGGTVIVKSTNQGATWSAPLPSSGARLTCFGVDPAHPERIFVGDGGSDARYSLDAGAHWIISHDVHPDIHSIAFCPTNSQRNYLGTDGGIYRADYAGGSSISWYSKNENLVGSLMRGVSLSSDDSMVMGNQDNGTQLYAAPTPNPPWAMILGGDGYQPKIDPNNRNKLYYQRYSYGSLVCNNGWESVVRVVNGVQTNITPTAACGERSQGFSALFMAPSDTARVIVGFKNVYRSADSGGTWTRIGPNGVDTDPGGAAFALSEAPSNTNVIYAVFDRLRVFVTSNAGQGNAATWSQVRNGYEGVGLISAITVDPVDSNTAFVASDTGVWKTIDKGVHWTQYASPNLLYRDVVVDPADRQHVFAASAGGVYASTDGGVTWGYMGFGMPWGLEVTSLSLNASSRRLAASTYGRGAYIMNLLP